MSGLVGADGVGFGGDVTVGLSASDDRGTAGDIGTRLGEWVL